MTNLDSILKSRVINWMAKVHLVKAMIFPVVMYGVTVGPVRRLSTEELMLFIVVLKKTLEGPLDRKEIKSVSSKGNKP